MAKWTKVRPDRYERPGGYVQQNYLDEWYGVAGGLTRGYKATEIECMVLIDSVLDGDEKHSGGILESAGIMPPHAATMAYARNPEKPMDVERRVDSMMAEGLKVAEEMEANPLPAGWQEIRPGWFDHISAGNVQRLPNGMWRGTLAEDMWRPNSGNDFTDASSAMHWVETRGGMERAHPYASLAGVLDAAYMQASEGKGRERHANDLPFEQQPIMTITRDQGLGFPLGQTMKKALEAQRMAKQGKHTAAEAELLGGIVYLAAAVLRLRELAGDDDFEDFKIGGTG